ncbi:CpsD/CapB family tyrosine-protein kinase [[Clostridium] innocuum]|nr:CpsD/CapB family tyrosine-protein kinase [Erysipelotrichaceae bacterium]MCR0382591.1 CpsD/CapB family tyrosine-protein kinase [[Clostridium] innocuum]MCR0414458.1 CpsD/CapB family tyrosine-protein kinase [[Clostridium] innocuum]MCR0536020.1 CpsD/CapB family tyrosine-protein kinase [[Clostridium] innocuum]MCR0539331.1 CpsD/CapB family tyrosine-protein kinase [[Clostridium] innocuum]
MERKIAPKRSDPKKHTKKSQFDNMEVYRQLRTNIEYSSFNKDIQVICVTSSNPAEGKSSVASNLATVAIAKYEKVLLIDCDLRKPVQHKIFKVSNKLGISNLMKDKSEVDLEIGGYFQKFKDNSTDGKLYVLTSGKSVPNPQEMLASDRFKELIEKFREMFDYIIIDCPPLNAVADAIPVSSIVDGTLFVVSAMDTDKSEAKNALTMLQRNGANVLGCVLTKVDITSKSYYSYYGNYS